MRFLTGSARYLPDLEAEDALHVAFVRSPHAHARIAGIDLSGLEGAAVLTGSDLANVGALPAGSS
ncbi:MAG TPA: hypothetical protein VFG61_09205, partial [Gaiellaceae bacterium]|nr:hypothetical protein [Gaiellaceae bacterium]